MTISSLLRSALVPLADPVVGSHADHAAALIRRVLDRIEHGPPAGQMHTSETLDELSAGGSSYMAGEEHYYVRIGGRWFWTPILVGIEASDEEKDLVRLEGAVEVACAAIHQIHGYEPSLLERRNIAVALVVAAIFIKSATM